MNQADRQDILKKVLLSVWGMLTMVLIFCVILLVNEMMERGQDPLDALNPDQYPLPTAPGAPAGEPSLGARDIMLYFAAQDGHLLAPEVRSIDFKTSTLENCRQVLDLLIGGPRDVLLPVLPPNTAVNAMYLLEDGELVVDLSSSLRNEQSRYRSARAESLLVFSIVNTLAQSALQTPGQPQVKRVRFLLEGSRPQETFPAHIDLNNPIKPDPSWVQTTESPAANAA